MKTRNWLPFGRNVAIAAASLGLTIGNAWSQDFKRNADVSAPATVPAQVDSSSRMEPAPSAVPASMPAITPGWQPVNAQAPALPVTEATPVVPQAMPAPSFPTANLLDAAAPANTDPDPTAVKRIVSDYLSELENKKKAADEAKKKEAQEKGTEVGVDLNLRAQWVEGVGLVFASQAEDWKIHFGGRFQFEPVFFREKDNLRGPATGNGGIPGSAKNGGIGIQDDGAYFRRVRLRSDGIGYGVIEYVLEVDFEQLNYITYDHMWFGAKDVPFLGTVRVGLHKVPVGMENLGSDYHLTLLERSSAADAFSILFGPGLWMSNNFFDDSVSFQTMLHKTQPLTFYTSSFGSGNLADSTRLTWTPLYEDEGREIIHVGASYQFRTGNLGRDLQPGGTGSTFGDSQNVMRFRGRSDLRDGVGIGGANTASGSTNGGPLALGSTARMVDTGYFLAKNAQTVVPEFLSIWGPFSIQAEGYLVMVDQAANLYVPNKSVGTPLGNPFFWGVYAEASYFLTGERRGYDRRFGMYDRPVLNDNAFMVRDCDGHMRWNLGAWQVAYRYTYLDLNSGQIQGGVMGQHTFGLNWYINNTTKVQFQYNISQRSVDSPAVSGVIQGFGMLAQWYF